MIDEIFRRLDTMIDALSPLNGLTDLALRMETVVTEVENASVMALRTLTSLLPDPKRRTEEGSDELRDVDSVRDGNVGGSLASPYPFLGAAGYKSCMAGNRTRFLRKSMPRVILRSLSGYRREKPLVLCLRARHKNGDPDGFDPVRLGRLDRQCDGLR